MDRRLALLVKFAALDKLTAPLRNMAAGAKRTGASIAGTRDELTQLQRVQSNLKGFREQEARLRVTSEKLQDVRKRLERLTAAEKGADAGTEKLAKAMANAKRTAESLERQFDEQGRSLQQLSRKLGAAGVDVTDLARHEQQLDRRVTETTAALKAQREELARNARTQQTLSGVQQAGSSVTNSGLGMLGSGLAVGAPIAAATDKAAEYRATMTDIALKTNLSEHETVRLGKAIAAIGPKVAQLPSDLRQGVDQLAGAGLDPRAAVQIIAPIGKAATATRASIEDLANASYAGIDNLKVPIGETARMLDIMTAAGKAGQFELKDMAQYFPALTASAAGLGQKGVPAIADLAAALQIARKGAGDAASAANNVQNLLNKINAKDTVDNFKKFGIDLPKALKRAYKEGKTPIEAIAELTNKATGGDMAKLSYLFGDAQVQAALRPLISNLEDYKKIRAAAEDASGTVDQDFARRATSGELATGKWAATFERLQVIAGTVLLPTLNQLLDKAELWTNKIVAWTEANPEAASSIMHLVAGLAAFAVVAGTLMTVLGPVIGFMGGFGKAMVKAWPIISPVIQLLGKGLWWLAKKIFPLFRWAIMFLARGLMQAGMMMMANPIILIIVAIIAVIALAAYLIYKHWDTIKAAFWSAVAAISQAWEAIKAWFAAGIQRLGAAWDNLKAIFNAGLMFLLGLHNRMVSIGVNIITGLADGIMSKFAWLRDKVTGLASDIGGWFSKALGIKSPSRVFMGFGGHIADGLAIGLDKGAAAPVQRINRIAGDLKSAFAAGAMSMPMAAAAATGGAAGAGGGAPANMVRIDKVEISIAAQPGQDPNAIAVAVRAELERWTSQQAAAQRSRYDDED